MRLIDADALKLDIMCVYGSNPKYINWLIHAPTVDAVPVIRCKDCRFRDQFGFCRRWLWQKAPKMEDDEYCSGAERKEE